MQQPSYDACFSQPEGWPAERDACGVGIICTLHDPPSHQIVRYGLEVLLRLSHRGACGCDERTGDGAGILVQLPDAFLREVARDEGICLPDPGVYGVGMIFLPREAAMRQQCQEQFEALIQAEGQRVLGWRRVPTQSEVLGVSAAAAEPSIWQVFVQAAPGLDAEAFERKLFVIKRMARHVIPNRAFYVVSLSARTLVYKGMLTPAQLGAYYPDLNDPRFASRLALVHSRFSTNTWPRWPLAQPFHLLAHNGEINTLRGNINALRAREALLRSNLLGEDLKKILPLLDETGSDSQMLDAMIELLYRAGRSLPHAILMTIPEAWAGDAYMDEARRAFYAYHACLMEPWDGPAAVCFTDGRYAGAVLDRNGLRPARYTITRDGLVVLASEVGVLDLSPECVVEKGRLQPGRMFLVDLEEGRLVRDEEIKATLSRRQPYQLWLKTHLRTEADLPAAQPLTRPLEPETLRLQQRLFGYSLEELRLMLAPMAQKKDDPVGSMGDDTPLAVLSDFPRLVYDYFKQLFAQVTNPPIDAIREELVTSLHTYLGGEYNLLEETPQQAHRLRLEQPILTPEKLARIKALSEENLRVQTLTTLFDVSQGGNGLRQALEELCQQAAEAVAQGATILVLSDQEAGPNQAPIPAALAVGAVHHHLIRTGLRARCSLIVDSGEPRQVHHMCVLLGYGADAICPYLALETIADLVHIGEITGLHAREAQQRYLKALSKGILKVMSKMGISVLQSYRGAQIFEIVGLGAEVVERCFAGTVSRLGGVDFDVLAEEVRLRYAQAYPPSAIEVPADALDRGGFYQWRRGGEHHRYNPLTVAKLQHAVRKRDPKDYEEFARLINEENQHLCKLRGLLDFIPAEQPLPLEEVEPWTSIVRRFKTGAMSFGSISQEVHETLAEAMNRLGGKSNTGEGGEDPERYARNNPRRSAIKQVASGRFGVTIGYLASADEIQIKMAQGAKPGEGGQLPGEKVYPWIARVRHSTPWVGLISPPPHHDIYSIEDLAQLIYDLKQANPTARISVKLVAEAGVGTIAAGVAKGGADVILISGHDGGTGASPITSILHAGLPWELGLTETHQALVANGLRQRVVVEVDGQLQTGRDVAIAALLGAQEFGFATAPLVALGCIRMRKCHLNTCPVGIATQDPELRKKFTGQPEHLINYFYFVAEELRQIMAMLGFRTVEEMVGRVDRLRVRTTEHWKARHLDLRPLIQKVETPEILRPFSQQSPHRNGMPTLDQRLLPALEPALAHRKPVRLRTTIRNTDRTVGARISYEITTRYGEAGLPEDTIWIDCEGSAGQSFGAFLAPGVTLRVAGEANDYFGKGLSGGKLIIHPPQTAAYPAESNIIIGNVALYGATSGEAYIRGRAGERFAVRNSGACAVVEGVGDHGCEYMTGGRVVVLGPTGRNFAAGMSGGIAYVLDADGLFARRYCNLEMVELMPVVEEADVAELRALIERHYYYTGSPVARWVLEDWPSVLTRFVKVFPIDYRKALERLAQEQEAELVRQQLAA